LGRLATRPDQNLALSFHVLTLSKPALHRLLTYNNSRHNFFGYDAEQKWRGLAADIIAGHTHFPPIFSTSQEFP